METRSRITLASSDLAPRQVRNSQSHFILHRLHTYNSIVHAKKKCSTTRKSIENEKKKETKAHLFLTVLDKSLVASCKDSIGWMFSKLDTNSDLYLDHAELAAINLDKYEVCIRPFFNSCDSYKDGKVSTAEWCLCFWREKPPCLAELERIQVQQVAKKKPGKYIYSHDCNCRIQNIFNGGSLFHSPIPDTHENAETPFGQESTHLTHFRSFQSHTTWRMPPHLLWVYLRNKAQQARIYEVAGYSGDFGSGVGWEDEEEKEAEDNGEEEEEEEGEADDGGYIWHELNTISSSSTIMERKTSRRDSSQLGRLQANGDDCWDILVLSCNLMLEEQIKAAVSCQMVPQTDHNV
ncbi:hypothetical protein PAMA_012375 [Pampus argenteus]